MKKISITIITVFLFWSNCALTNEIGYGEIKNGIYENNYFNMYLPVPNGWSVQSKAAIDEIVDVGTSLIVGDDKNLRALLKEAEKQTINMFVFFKHEQGAPVEFNPSITAVAERVTNMPGIKRGGDYFFHVKKLLLGAQVEYHFPKKMYTEEISGVLFDVMPAELSIGGVTVHQEYYAIRTKDYILTFILTYLSDQESRELNEIINKLRFSK